MSCEVSFSYVCLCVLPISTLAYQRQQRFTPHCRPELLLKNSSMLCVGQSKHFLSVRASSKPGHSPHSECEYCVAEVLRAERKWNPFFVCVRQQQLLAR
jgi:hypothetical protein